MRKTKKLNGRAKFTKLPTKRTATAHSESVGGNVRKAVGKKTSLIDVLRNGNLPRPR